MSGNHFLHFGTETGKPKKKFLVFGTGAGNTRSHSHCSGRDREIQKTIPVVWDGNGKTHISFPLNGTGTGNLKML